MRSLLEKSVLPANFLILDNNQPPLPPITQAHKFGINPRLHPTTSSVSPDFKLNSDSCHCLIGLLLDPNRASMQVIKSCPLWLYLQVQAASTLPSAFGTTVCVQEQGMGDSL